MDPFAAADGLSSVVPTGISKDVTLLILTCLPEKGVSVISLGPEVSITELVIVKTSLTFKEFVVFKTPAVVIFPLDSAIEIVVPISKFPSRVTGAVIVRADELIPL